MAGIRETWEMRNSWLGLLWARMWVEGKAVDAVHGVFLVFTLFLTCLLLSSPRTVTTNPLRSAC